jgi:hypothetical protein
MSDYIYVALIDVPEDIEDDFNRLYDEVHVPDLLKVPGVRSAARYRLESADSDEIARYMAIYEVDGPDVAGGPAWRAASDKGEWVTRIRPRFARRQHGLFRRIS